MNNQTRRIFKKWTALLLAALAWALLDPAAAPAQPPGDQGRPAVLMQAEELKALLDAKDHDLRIIDFRHKAKYYLGHIPGAVQLWRPEITDRDQALPGQPASRERLEKLLGRLGVGSGNTIVIYSDQCDHAFLWWILAYYGFPLERLKLLDGGLAAWQQKAYPAQLTSPRPKPATFRFPAADRKSLLATREQVKAALAAPGSVILDIRTREQYLGKTTKEGAARRGHIPGAVWIDWQQARVQAGPLKGCWQSPSDLRQLYAEPGVTPEKDIYIYGHTTPCAAYTLVSLYVAGYPLEKLHVYGGSWIDWSRSGEPVEAAVPRPVKDRAGH